MERILLDELPIIPVYFNTRTSLRDTRVKGFHSNVLDHHPFKYVYLEQ
jgi:oligopeptide transport system substrate-binding protein